MSDIEFAAWPKIPRLNRGMVITEKIDGTNAAVVITDDGRIAAQSRNRLITPDDDNYGFAGWVSRNRDALIDTLGEGRHFGEWWGSGIQRGYGLKGPDKRFSLFNTTRWVDTDLSAVPGLGVVPVLHTGPFDNVAVNATLTFLAAAGSVAVPGFMKPEGIIVYLSVARMSFKVTVEHDGLPKSAVAVLPTEAVA